MNKQPKPVTRHTLIQGLTLLLALCLTMSLLAGCGEQPSDIIRPLPPELVGGSGSSSSAGADTPESSPSAGKDTSTPSGIDWGKDQEIANSADVSLLLEQVTLGDIPLKFPFTVNELGPEFRVVFDEQKMSYPGPAGTVWYSQYAGSVFRKGVLVSVVFTEDNTRGREGDAEIVAIMGSTDDLPLRVCGIGEGDTTEEMYAALGAPAEISHLEEEEAFIFYKNETQTISFVAERKGNEWILDVLQVIYLNNKEQK